MFKKAIISSLMAGVVIFAFASKGGGGDKNKTNNLKDSFDAVRTTNGFTLRAAPRYTGSKTFSSQRNGQYLTFNSVVTYQKGNTILIVPSQQRVSMGTINMNLNSKNNFRLLDLRINLGK